jgi:two-component system, chemotaxis family, response regulator Rcp1
MPALMTWNVLLVEDNPGDVGLIRMSAERFPGVKLHHVPNAVQAHRYLLNQHPFQEAPAPDLVLLDLRMPVFDGTSVLESMRETPQFHDTPVVVFTSSTLLSDRARCQELGATSFLTKPSDWTAWQTCVAQVLARHLKGFPGDGAGL